MFVCPMHPEIRQEKPGRCPKCGMRLVPEESLIKEKETTSYTPLIVVIGLILTASLALTLKDMQLGAFHISKTISYFMIGFFLTFSGFKLMDLRGFAEGYATYDLLAQKWAGYGHIYPFMELGFGLGMIVLPHASWLLLCEFVVMILSGIGVAIKLLKHERFQCACLGTFLKVPLTKVTLIEDFGMALLAAVLFVFK